MCLRPAVTTGDSLIGVTYGWLGITETEAVTRKDERERRRRRPNVEGNSGEVCRAERGFFVRIVRTESRTETRQARWLAVVCLGTFSISAICVKRRAARSDERFNLMVLLKSRMDMRD